MDLERSTMAKRKTCSIFLTISCLGLAFTVPQAKGQPTTPTAYLASVHKHHLLASTVPANGDQNPYALVVAPVTSGSVQKNDLLVDNFNDRDNLQGTGTTIIDY